MTNASVGDLASLIYSKKQALDRAFKSELVNFEVRYGSRIVTEALQLVERMETDSKLSIVGLREREHEAKRRAEQKHGAHRRRG
jgi:hypothetical protein